MLADDRADSGLLRPLRRTLGLCRDAERAVYLLWPPLRHASLDLRSGRTGSHVRSADPDGRVHVRAAEDDADDGRSAPGEDDAADARGVHVHVPESAVWARALLDALERAPDRPAALHGAQRNPREAARSSCQEGVTAVTGSRQRR